MERSKNAGHEHEIPLHTWNRILCILLIDSIHVCASRDWNLHSHVSAQHNVEDAEHSFDDFEGPLFHPSLRFLALDQVVDVDCHAGWRRAVDAIHMMVVARSSGWGEDAALVFFH